MGAITGPAQNPATQGSATILVIQDDPDLHAIIERGLGRPGVSVDTATDGAAGLARALDPLVDLVVLDLALPEPSGEALLRQLRRERPELPVIVLTAHGEIGDRVACLDAGAVDCMVKPFAPRELAARIRAQLRLTGRGDTVLEVGEIRVDLISRRVTVTGSEARLSATEFALLVHLMRHAGKLLTREQILRVVWGYTHDPGTNVLDVYIGYLRRKLAAAGAANPIVTVRSRGYRFDAGR